MDIQYKRALALSLLAGTAPMPQRKIVLISAPVATVIHTTGAIVNASVDATNKTLVVSAITLLGLTVETSPCNTSVFIVPNKHDLGAILDEVDRYVGVRLRIDTDGTVKVLEHWDERMDKTALGELWTKQLTEVTENLEKGGAGRSPTGHLHLLKEDDEQSDE